MRPLKVDFAKPALWPVALVWALVAALFASGAWQGLLAGKAWRRLDGEVARTAQISSQVARLRVDNAAAVASAAASTPFAADARHWMQMSEFDVAGVLRSIESVQLIGAKVSGLTVDTQTGRVEIELEVGSTDIATAYVRALNEGLDKPRWWLVRVQTQGGAQTALIRNQGVPA